MREMSKMKLTKQININFLQGVNTAKLVEFVMYFVEYERFIVIGGEIFHNRMY